MEILLFAPPVVFAIFVLLFLLFSRKLSKYSTNHERKFEDDHEADSYACGEKNVKHYVNPDYSQFFPYAFFFTILHVLVLVVVTAPKDSPILPIAYIVSGALAMLVMFKKDES